MTALEEAAAYWGIRRVRLHPGGQDPRVLRRAEQLAKESDRPRPRLGRNPLDKKEQTP